MADDGQAVAEAASAAGIEIGRATTAAVHTLAGERATQAAIDWRRRGLWASLLAGVAVLAWMAWRLVRQLAGARRNGPGGGPAG